MTDQQQTQAPLALIVDDDSTVRIVMRSVLESHDIRVNEAADGIAALESFNQETPDIVVLDIEMPKKNGLEACADIRRHPKGKLIPIMMSTGMDDTDSIQLAYDAGATDFAVKPLNWPIFGHRIRYMLQAAQAIHDHHTALQTAARLGKVVESSSNEIYICNDHSLTLLQTNNRARTNTGFSELETQQLTLDQLTPELSTEQLKTIVSDLYRHEYPEQLLTTHLARKDGSTYPAELSLQLSREDKENRLVVIAQDITERKQAEDRMRQLAYYDRLTGLPNRQFFLEQLAQLLKGAQQSDRKIVVLYIDLDNFKRINDTLGHTIGDELLIEIANRLKHSTSGHAPIARHITSNTDIAVSRLSGDEFAIILDRLEDTAIAGTIAKYLLNILSRPMTLQGHELLTTFSIGIAIAPTDSDDQENLLKHADTAMHHAKKSGKNTYQYYNNTMNSTGHERLQLETELRRAVTLDELCLFYQPQVDAQTGNIVSAEALVRWQHPKHGLLGPDRFIPLAEEMGLITDIGNWVLRQACKDMKSWLDNDMKLKHVGVNLSSLQFKQPNLVNQIQKVLIETGLDAKHLALELTESVIMNDADTTIATLHALKAMGFRLSVDDFGTGYSSLNYLSKFPLDELKIDKSFIADVDTDSQNNSIVTAIVAMAKSLGLKLVAEGVETEQQLSFVQKQRVDLVQGFYFSKPLKHMHFRPKLLLNLSKSSPKSTS